MIVETTQQTRTSTTGPADRRIPTYHCFLETLPASVPTSCAIKPTGRNHRDMHTVPQTAAKKIRRLQPVILLQTSTKLLLSLDGWVVDAATVPQRCKQHPVPCICQGQPWPQGSKGSSIKQQGGSKGKPTQQKKTK